MTDSTLTSSNAITGSFALGNRTEAPALDPTRRMTAILGATILMTMIPVTMLVPVLKELVAERFHAGPFATHSFMCINLLGAVLAAPIGGALADRWQRRKPLLILALAADAVLLLSMSFAGSLSGLLTLRFFEGAAHITALTGVMALAADWAGTSRRGRMMGLVGGTLMLGTSIGAPLGGRLGQLDATFVLKVGAAISALAALLATVGIHDAPVRRASARVRDALLLLRRRPAMLVPYAYSAIDRFCVGLIVSTFVLFLADRHHLSPAERGGLLAFFLFPMALLCFPVGRLADRVGRVALMAGGSLGFGVVFALYGYMPMSWMTATMIASGVLSAVMFAPNLALCADFAPPEARASAFAGFNVAGSIGFIAGPIIGGTIIHAFAASDGVPIAAYRAVFIVGGVSQFICVAATLPYLLKFTRRPSS
ncbi:MAG: MFS transporter [Phycisphaerales bacterium]|nr:MFS transporter [Phycisphaerales bacterium]